MVGFVLNGFVFVLIGLELPEILAGLGGRSPGEIVGLVALVSRRRGRRADRLGLRLELAARTRRGGAIARRDPRLALAARRSSSAGPACAVPSRSPRRSRCRPTSRSANLILLLTFAVILVTLVGQGLTLPFVMRWAGWDGTELDGDEPTRRPRRGLPGRPRRDRARPPGLARPPAAARPAGVGPPRSDPSTSPPRIPTRPPSGARSGSSTRRSSAA